MFTRHQYLRPRGSDGISDTLSRASDRRRRWRFDHRWVAPRGTLTLLAIRDALAIGREFPLAESGTAGPFGLADPDHVRRVLGDAGFAQIKLDPLDADIDLGADVDSAYRYTTAMGVTRGLTAGLDDEDRSRALAALKAALSAHATPNGVRMPGAAWRITAARD